MAHDEDNLLLIRCPSCSQRFKVPKNLNERMVECGVCENRFHVRGDVIIRMRKFYPGESSKPGLESFHRITPPSGIRPNLQAAQYRDAPPTIMIEPATPLQVISGIAGVSLMILMGLAFIFGQSHGGFFDGVDISRRFIVVSFTALIGLILVIFANPRARLKAGVFGGMIAAVLVSLPLFIHSPAPTLADPSVGTPPAPATSPTSQEDSDSPEYIIGLRPLTQEIQRLADENSKLSAFGINLIGLRQSNRLMARDFLIRITNADPSSHLYPRDSTHSLMLLTGLELSIEETARKVAQLGSLRAIVPDLNVIEVIVDNDLFLEAPMEMVTNRDHPSFYEMNLRELNNFDLTRVEQAAQRLIDAEPRVYRVDITRKLRTLLADPNVTFHTTLARALQNWDEEPAASAQVAADTAVRLHNAGSPVPIELMTLASAVPSQPLADIAVSQWLANSLGWEKICIAMGSYVEDRVIEDFREKPISRVRSATQILGEIGGEKSVIALREVRQNANPELVLMIDSALAQIAER